MKIHKTNIWLELNDIYEDSKGITKPYYVERQESDKEVVWFGLETNWKMIKGAWYILYKGDWKESNKPKYEEIYLKLKEDVGQGEQLVCDKCDEDGWIVRNEGDIISRRLCNCDKAK